MGQVKTGTLLLLLIGIVILLMVAIAGLFLRMMQLQSRVLAALQPFQAMSQPEGLEVGTQAPIFTLTDSEGRPVSLANLTGQRLLLVFSSTHCPACQAMYPHLQAFCKSHQDLRVVMISRGSVEENRALVEEQGFGFPVLSWDGTVAGAYQVPGTPFFYVIDGAGTIINRGFAGTLAQLEALVEGSGE